MAGALLRQLPDRAHDRLAETALHLPEARSLMDGYAAWDGVDPPPSTRDYDRGADERSGHGESHDDIVKGRAEGGFST